MKKLVIFGIVGIVIIGIIIGIIFINRYVQQSSLGPGYVAPYTFGGNLLSLPEIRDFENLEVDAKINFDISEEYVVGTVSFLIKNPSKGRLTLIMDQISYCADPSCDTYVRTSLRVNGELKELEEVECKISEGKPKLIPTGPCYAYKIIFNAGEIKNLEIKYPEIPINEPSGFYPTEDMRPNENKPFNVYNFIFSIPEEYTNLNIGEFRFNLLTDREIKCFVPDYLGTKDDNTILWQELLPTFKGKCNYPALPKKYTTEYYNTFVVRWIGELGEAQQEPSGLVECESDDECRFNAQCGCVNIWSNESEPSSTKPCPDTHHCKCINNNCIYIEK